MDTKPQTATQEPLAPAPAQRLPAFLVGEMKGVTTSQERPELLDDFERARRAMAQATTN